MKKLTSLALSSALALSLVACGGSSAPIEVDADWTPSETITMIVSYSAGSGTDTTARILTSYAKEYLGQNVIIENLEGGSGSIGWTRLSNAKADGYTLGFINLPNFSSSITEELGDYTVDDFTAIANHVTETSVVLVSASSPFNSLEELVAFGQENPSKLKASTNGNRASNHIGAQMFANSAEFLYSAIPYGGTSDQLLALRQGEVDFSVAKLADFASFPSEVKVLGAFDTSRLVEYPEVPTLGELGYYGEWLGSSRCIVAPAGTPDTIIEFYEAAFQAIMEDTSYLAAASTITTDFMDATATSDLIASQQIFAEGLESIWY